MTKKKHNKIETIIYTIDNRAYAFCVTGHAGEVRKGNNIVCSAISILVQTVLRYFDSINVVKISKILDNYIYVEIDNSINSVAIETAFKILLIGICDLENEYPELVKLYFERK